MKNSKSLPSCYTESSKRLLASRFLKTTRNGTPIETPRELWHRVSFAVAKAEDNYSKDNKNRAKAESDFFEILFDLRFIPNSPTIISAGRARKTLSACFVLPLEDSLDSIYQTLSDAVQVQWKGGGTGFNFSKIRPKGDEAGGIPDVAAGPVHIIKTFSEALMGIRQGGKRGGGNMAILNVDHPDILDFIHLKERDRSIMNFNISVGLTDRFMEALRNDEKFKLINPRTNKAVKELPASYVFNEIVQMAYKTGDPGIAFIDNIAKANPTPNLGHMDATNPCGEQPLLPYESCNLGHINLLTHFDYKKSDLDWSKVKDTVHKAVHFLDNIVDINYFPLKKIEEITRFKNRKIGLGLMGLADVLILKEVPYNSIEGIRLAKKIMKFIHQEGIKASLELAKKRGTFPAYKGSLWEKRNLPLRNATITTIAPTGNTSIIGGATGGIEPAYALAYKIGGVEDKNYRATEILFNVNQAFVHLAKKYKFYSEKLIEQLASGTSVSEIHEIPDRLKPVLVTALDIEPQWHLQMQAAFQESVDSAISKTINFPNDATADDIRKVFIEAYKLGLKGVTIFRDGSKDSQTYVSTKEGQLNVTKKFKEHLEFVIASRNKKKINDIKEFLSEFNGSFKVEEYKGKIDIDDPVRIKTTEKKLISNAIRRATQVAKKCEKISLADETGFLVGKKLSSKSLDKTLYLGRANIYSASLFKKLINLQLKSSTKAYIASAVAIYDPIRNKTISTVAKIPGRIVRINDKKFELAFIHQGLDSFSKVPSKEDFRSFHHRYKALQKLLEKFNVYRKEKIEVTLSKNAYHVLERRALRKDKDGKVTETPNELFERIAEYISRASKRYGYSTKEIEDSKQRFMKILKNLEFLCGGALIWAGMSDDSGKRAIWSKCFVLPIEDSIRNIFNTLNDNIEVLRHGGGTGFNFSRIRSTYATVSSTGEKAAGPVSYLKVFNRAQETIIGRGGRQMGSMAILNIDHPNIPEFISAKNGNNDIVHYNISVGITDEFMKAVQEDKRWELIDPHDGNVYRKLHAQDLFKKIASNAWASGDPGVVFIDRLEKDNPTPDLGKIDATNVCGEQPLLPYESCNLGNINLTKIVKGFPFLDDSDITKHSLAHKLNLIDWAKFESIIDSGVEFLDNIIDINNYPIPQIEKMTKQTRSIGLGIMGFADLLIKLGIPYDSNDAQKVAEKIMKFLKEKSHQASGKLAERRGNFPGFKGSVWDKKAVKKMRNSRCTTIAPTGTVSIVGNCNPGIEPIFSLVFKRMQSLGGEDQIVVEPLFEEIAKARGFYTKELMESLSEGKKISEFGNIPNDVKMIFKTSHDIEPEQHVKIQSAFQKYCDSAVSKTINLPNSATVKDVRNIFLLAYRLGCKGITIFREGCKAEAQSSNIKEQEDQKESKTKVSSEPRPRPAITHGTTTQVQTDQGRLYLTINEDEKGLTEVFLNIGKSGGYSSGYCEAIGRLISISARAGLSVDSIIDQLKGIRTSAPTLNKGMFVYSVPDAVAKVLENWKKEREGRISMFVENNTLTVKTEKDIAEEEKKERPKKEPVQDDKTIATKSENPKKEKHESKYSNDNKYDDLPECPECSSDLEYAEGCILCRSCGYSKCG
ncbi:MAG: adenosylcobalamin-dependent ribonucleoside-diphosphate reductase [Candidatus Dojkabacteria bacterium]|nr:adenosylcobalamin-dependent ribonucleoside-diphosphate reductase [Candidatus Dojkabacteria bacterium]